jgi:hypothetical protein
MVSFHYNGLVLFLCSVEIKKIEWNGFVQCLIEANIWNGMAKFYSLDGQFILITSIRGQGSETWGRGSFPFFSSRNGDVPSIRWN